MAASRAIRSTVLATLSLAIWFSSPASLAQEVPAEHQAAAGELENAMTMVRNTKPEQRSKVWTEEMTKLLDLNKDQQGKVAKINLEHAQGMQSIAEDTSKTALEQLLDMRNVRNQQLTALENVLTAAQFNTYMDNLPQLREKMQQTLGDKAKSSTQGQ